MEGVTGTIMLFGGNFPPRAWGTCNGALMPISQNGALFSLLGTNFGGDGRVTFGIPDLRGRVSVGTGKGPGLTDRRIGNKWGNEIHTLTVDQMPVHGHVIGSTGTPSATVTVKAKSGMGNQQTADGTYWATSGTQSGPSQNLAQNSYSSTADTSMAADAIEVNVSGLASSLQASTNGASQSFFISQPSLAVSHVICLTGIFPSRN